MAARDILTQWLAHGARRLRLNLWLREASAMACCLLGAAALYQVVRVALAIPGVIAASLPLLLLAGGAGVIYFAWRLSRGPTLAQAATAADRVADLKDELRSALWFSQQATAGAMVERVVERASHTVQRLDPRRVFPVVMPRGVPVAGALALLTCALAPFSPQASVPVSDAPSLAVSTTSQTDNRVPQPHPTIESTGATPTGQRLQRPWTQIDELLRELAPGPQRDEIAQAIAARDAKSAMQLVEALRRRTGAQSGAAPAARPAGEQMSAALAQDILERLQHLANEGGDAEAQAAPQADGEQPTARLTRELREEGEEVQRSRPAQQSAGEDALNTLLRAISRNSTGGRQVVRGETEAMQEAGRTSVGGGGAMGRRVGVSQAGGGDGDQPRSDPAGDADAEPVLGKKTQRLATQLQTIKVQQSADDNRQGSEDAFYAATQAQASRVDYEAVAGQHRGGAEQDSRGERAPLAYRDAIKHYTLSQHRRDAERAKDAQ